MKTVRRTIVIVSFIALLLCSCVLAWRFAFSISPDLDNSRNYLSSSELAEFRSSSNFGRQTTTLQMTKEEKIEIANVVLIGTFLGSVGSESHIDHIFQVNNVAPNYTYDDPFIEICEFRGEENYPLFSKGNSYLLVVSRIQSVYFEHTRNDLLWVEDYTLDESESRDFLQKQTRTADYPAKSKKEVEGLSFINSDQIDTIIENSPYLLELQLIEVLSRDDELGIEVCACVITDVLKGENVSNGGEAYLNFFQGTVQVGSTYLVALNRSSVDSLVYSLAAKHNAVIPSSSAIAQEIRNQFK